MRLALILAAALCLGAAGEARALSFTMPTVCTIVGTCAPDSADLVDYAPTRWELGASWQSPSWAANGSVWGLSHFSVWIPEAQISIITTGYALPGARVTIVTPATPHAPRSFWVRTVGHGGTSCWSGPITLP